MNNRPPLDLAFIEDERDWISSGPSLLAECRHLRERERALVAALTRLDRWAEQDRTGASCIIQGIISEARAALAGGEASHG